MSPESRKTVRYFATFLGVVLVLLLLSNYVF